MKGFKLILPIFLIIFFINAAVIYFTTIHPYQKFTYYTKLEKQIIHDFLNNDKDKAVKALIAAKDKNYREGILNDAFVYVVFSGNIGLAKELLSYGADPDYEYTPDTEFTITPLMIASDYHMPEMLELLIETSKNPDRKINNIFNLKKKKPYEKIINKLTDKKVQKKKKEELEEIKKKEKEIKNPPTRKILVKLNMNKQNIAKKTPIIQACNDGNDNEKMDQLYNKIMKSYKYTNTDYKIDIKKQTQTVKILSKHNARSDMTDKDGLNAFDYAESSKNPDLLYILLLDEFEE